MAICPICGAESKPRSENPAFPFCTPRCKTVDLGKWLNEEYRLPVDDSSDEEESDGKVQDEIVRH